MIMAAASSSSLSIGCHVLLGISAALVFMVGSVSSSKFDELFQPSWAFDHFSYEGETLKMKLDNYSGAGFSSKSKYMFGKVTVQIKLVEGDSAGTVTAFYMSSDGPKHHEFDFEFLGNITGEPYLVQTNVYVNGVGNREQRLNLWFDPTEDFHYYSILWNQRQVVKFLGNITGEPYLVQTNVYVNGVGNREQRLNLWFDPTEDFHYYSILWNQRQVVFLVDETPIRVYSNLEHKGVPFPKDQAMGVYSSIWNADDWATQGGRVKTDWTHAPFIASYRGFQIDGCECPATVVATDNSRRCSSSAEKRFWWDEPRLSELNLHQSHQLLWVRANHMIYDYCTDTARFPVTPVECLHHHH